MEGITAILAAIAAVISVITLITVLKNKGALTKRDLESALKLQKDELTRENAEVSSRMKSELSRSNNDSITMLAKLLKEDTRNNFELQSKSMSTSLEGMQTQLMQFEKRLGNFASESELKLENIRKTVDVNLKELREDNNRKLDDMKKTVDEKLQNELQKRMRESFAEVSALLERVQKDIGSMRTLAEDVGGLKRSLTNIKTRGMMGEFLLENILSDVFAANQYEKNAHPNPDNPNAVVEFALKIPTDDDEFIYLPIDSKFPRDKYDAVLTASEQGDKVALDSSIKQYVAELKRCAGDISKYIAPPYTTDYAIMFLPTESMYADAVNHGMLDEIWRLHKVYITGPSTVAALLGSMQLSFSNMAIQKRANEVFGVLNEVKLEFNKFSDVLEKMQKHLNQASDDLTDLLGVRTKKLNKKLNNISKLALGQPHDVLDMPDDDI